MHEQVVASTCFGRTPFDVTDKFVHIIVKWTFLILTRKAAKKSCKGCNCNKKKFGYINLEKKKKEGNIRSFTCIKHGHKGSKRHDTKEGTRVFRQNLFDGNI